MSITFLPDVNIWFALSRKEHQFHLSAYDWISSVPAHDRIHFNRSTQQSLLRLVTTSAIMHAYSAKPLTNTDAWTRQNAWYKDDRISFVDEPPQLEPKWRSFGAIGTASPKLWMDAYLAAFAIASNAQLVTTDKAFRQFKGLDLLVIA